MRRLAARSALLAAALLLAHAAPARAQHQHHAAPPKPPALAQAAEDPGYQRFKRDLAAGMDKMMSDMHAPGYAGDPDIDFLAMMIPHHEGAVDMARLLLLHGRDPATRRLAADIIASQQVEIEGMKRRLAMLRAKEGASAGGYPELGGARGPTK